MNLDAIIKQVSKETGTDIQFAKGNRKKVLNLDVYPSGSLSLDWVLGCNGFPKGRILEIFGPESGGKSTLALLTIAEVQKSGKPAVYIDAESGFDISFAEQLGVDTKKLIYYEPETAEEAFEVVEKFLETKEIGIIVIDSIEALVPKEEYEGAMDKWQMGLKARVMGKALRKLKTKASHSNTLMIMINQLREKL